MWRITCKVWFYNLGVDAIFPLINEFHVRMNTSRLIILTCKISDNYLIPEFASPLKLEIFTYFRLDLFLIFSNKLLFFFNSIKLFLFWLHAYTKLFVIIYGRRKNKFYSISKLFLYCFRSESSNILCLYWLKVRQSCSSIWRKKLN